MADFELLAPGGHQELVDEVLDRLDTKADYDGYYQQLTAGAADNLTGRGDGVSASYLYRTTGGDADVADGTATVKSIHGRTVVWNQRVEQVVDAVSGNQGTRTFDSTTKVWTIVSTVPEGSSFGFYAYPSATRGAVGGHKSLICADVKLSTAGTAKIGVSGSQTTVQVGTDFTHLATIVSPANDSGMNVYTTGADGLTMQAKNVQTFDLTAMFGAGNEPATVAEFEALYPLPYYPYDAGSLLSVQMEGIETVGFNQWDEEWEIGSIDTTTGANTTNNTRIRSKNFIPVFPSTDYHITLPATATAWVLAFDADKGIIDGTGMTGGGTSGKACAANASHSEITTPNNCAYLRFFLADYGTTYNNDICINLSWSGYRDGEYEPYWKSERTIPAATYFPSGMRSAGTVYDELTETQAITRIGEVDLGTLTWTRNATYGHFMAELSGAQKPSGSNVICDLTCARYTTDTVTHVTTAASDKTIAKSATNDNIFINDTSYTDATIFKAAMSGVMLHYALATPTMQAIDPPLNLTYRAAAGGTERVTHTDPTAAPTLVVTYGSTADGIRDRALSAIAPVENGRASANYGIGSYLIHGGQLCRVTTAIAAGEAITIGTNVTATTVMAEVLSLVQ